MPTGRTPTLGAVVMAAGLGTRLRVRRDQTAAAEARVEMQTARERIDVVIAERVD